MAQGVRVRSGPASNYFSGLLLSGLHFGLGRIKNIQELGTSHSCQKSSLRIRKRQGDNETKIQSETLKVKLKLRKPAVQ